MPTRGSEVLLRLSGSLTAEGVVPGLAHLTPPKAREHSTLPGSTAAFRNSERGGTAQSNLYVLSVELHKVKLLPLT